MFHAEFACGETVRAFGHEREFFADACERHAHVCDDVESVDDIERLQSNLNGTF